MSFLLLRINRKVVLKCETGILKSLYGISYLAAHRSFIASLDVYIIAMCIPLYKDQYVQRSLLKTIRKRQMEFLGHVCRRRGLEFLSLTGKVEGKRDRGKQRITFLDSLCNSATGGQSKGLNFLKLSDDRDVWRGMAANVCSRSGT